VSARYSLASRTKRLLATVIDMILVPVLNGLTLFKSGQTLGKRLLGIAIVPNEKDVASLTSITPASWWKLICIRALFFPLLFLAPLLLVPGMLPFGLAPVIDQLMIFTKGRRCLHDLLAGTMVINTKTN